MRACWWAQEQRNAVARFLEGRGLAAEALEVATDADYRFELAVGLGELNTALALAAETGTEAKWRQLGELALSAGKLQARALSSTLALRGLHFSQSLHKIHPAADGRACAVHGQAAGAHPSSLMFWQRLA